MKRSSGAVTVFLIVVLFSVVLLGGLFIDASRVLLAKRFIRNAADSAARSALSCYDEHLASEYGLFAVDGETAEETFKRYFKTNINLAKNDGFNILKMEAKDESISVTVSSPIIDQETMLESMQEYSKYRVVVNTSYGIIEKLKGLFGSEGRAEKTFNAADTGKTAKEQLEADVKEFSNKARAYISSGITTQTNNIKNTISNVLNSGKTSFSDEDLGFDRIEAELDAAENENNKINGAKDTYIEKSNAANKEIDEASRGSAQYWDEESQTMKTETSDDSNMESDSEGRSDVNDNLSGEAEKERQAVQSKIDSTRSRFEENKQKIREKSNEAAACNEQIKKLTATKDTLSGTVNILQTHLNTLQSNKLRDRFNFILGEDSDARLKELKENYDILGNELALLRTRGASETEINDKKAELDAAEEALERYVEEAVTPPKTVYDEEIEKTEKDLKEAKASLTATENALKAETDKRDKLVNDIQKLYDEIAEGSSAAGELKVPDSISGKDQEKVDSNAGAFITQMIQAISATVNEMSKLASNVHGSAFDEFSFGPVDLLGDLLEDIWRTITEMKEMGDGLITLVTKPSEAGPAMLFTDYVFSSHTFLTSRTPRHNRHFQAAEIEYILTGEDSQALALIKTVGNVALLRLTINWVDYLATTHSPEIISRMIIALGRAAIRTVEDMASMIFSPLNGDTATCALSPSFSKVRLTYSDHLRLSMMLRAIGSSGRESMMKRVQTMMRDTYEFQGWGSLDTLQTRIHGDVTVEVDLVMLTLPMFESVLPKDNQILQNGKFLVHETVDMGY